ncbi:MAG: phosphoenolpyruvate--protein phosphotransferase [Xanthomonadales bacterium]|nr:phosphoenolpyruvate--protein phosphotransferase [Xanthomonadales bacterium]
MTLAMTGHPVVPGIAVGQAHIMRRSELNIGEYRIDAGQVEAECERLHTALKVTRASLDDLASRLGDTAGHAAEEIIRTHVAMLSDPSVTRTVEEHIREDLCNAEWALQRYLESLLSRMDRIDDPYIRERGRDAEEVVQRVQEALSRQQSAAPLPGVPDRLGDTLVIATELAPGELAALHQRGVAGIVTEHGSPHSHTAILARSLGIPAVMGVHRGQSLVRENETLVLDGHYGVVFADPEESIRRHYLRKQTESDRFREKLAGVRERPSVSLDGVEIRLMANAERHEDLELARSDGADGVGLFRTEFMFMEGRPPGEEAQYRRFREALEVVAPGLLTIRTLDLGADKGADLLDFENLRSSQNPALGLRAVRLCLREMDVFTTQLRAILRASAHGPVACLIPMLTSVGELHAVKALIERCREDLSREGRAYDPDMPIGGMIEVPAAALALHLLARELDFISVGTNDLIQFALATDRVDEQVAHLYDPQHPGVLKLLRNVFDSARAAGCPVSVCGELAGDRQYTRLLLALGLTEFSMAPRHLLEVKRVITETDVSLARHSLDAWEKGSARDGSGSLVDHIDRVQSRGAEE